MNIEAINGEWFYDDVTPRGVSFDGFLPQACKIPLGNLKDFELIHTPKKMAEFQSNDWYQKNWGLADTLMTFSPLRSEKSVLVEAYRNEIDKILSCPCDSESCQHDASSDAWPTRGSCRGLRVLDKDLSLYGDIMTGNNNLDEGKFYDVKKEIYRLPDRVIAALAKCCEVKSAGIFVVLDELFEKEVISSEARDNLSSASAIAIKLRLSTYLKAGKQGELLNSNSNDKTGGKALVYNMPTDEELFHFFFVAIPLYDELRQFKTSRNLRFSLANNLFFNDSHLTMGHIYCRLLKYDKAIECYERAVRESPNNLSAEIRRIRVALFTTHNPQELDKIGENLDDLLGKLVENFAQLDSNVNKTLLEFTPLMKCVDLEECRQLFEGLLFANEVYRSSKYMAVAEKIMDLFKTSNSTLQFLMLYSTFVGKLDILFVQEYEIDFVVSRSTLIIEREGVSTRSIVWLNRLGEFLFCKDKLDKAYRCFQRALSMEHLLYGTRPNSSMMTSLTFLGTIARDLEMHKECKFYFECLVQLCESLGGIKSKLLIKDTYLQLSFLSCSTPDETLRYAENGLKVTIGSKSAKEQVFNCWLYCVLAINLQSPERAWEAILNAKACRNHCTHALAREYMISAVGVCLCAIEKSKEGIELLEKELQKLTSKSQVQEKVLCLKALGKLCLLEGLAPEAKKYYSQAMDNLLNINEHVFDDLECRIGILKATIMENSKSKEKTILDKDFFNSVIELPASNKKCFLLQEIGGFCQSIGETDDARLCCIEALRSAKELPACNEKCTFLRDIGVLCESISDIALAKQCYDQAVNTYKEESNISKKPPFLEVHLEMKLGFLAKEMCNIDSAQQIHFDRAAAVLRQHVATGQVDSKTVLLFLIVSKGYSAIDQNEEIRLQLEGLELSEIVYEKDKSQEMVTTVLQELSRTYYLSGDMQKSMKYKERQIKMELKLHSDNPFLERIVNTLIKWAFISFHVPSRNDSIELVCDYFLSSWKNKTFLLNTTSAKTIAAKCFTFMAVLFYTASDIEKAKSMNEKASHLFGEVQESVQTETDPCRETCDLMETMLSSDRILPSHRRELFISILNIGGPHPNVVSTEEEWLLQQCRHYYGVEEELITEVKQQARSTSVKEQNTMSPELFVQLHLEALEDYKSKGEFRLAAEILTSLQPKVLSFYENSFLDGEEKLISDAIEAKDKNEPSEAIRLLDIASQLELPEGQCRRTPKILKLRAECFLSLGHFRRAAIDFTKAKAFYSIETIDNREELCEYSEVLIGLVKSEILCNNLDAAWLICEKEMKVASYHEFKADVYLQFLFLNILSKSGENKEEILDKAIFLSQQADFSMYDHVTKEGGSISVEEIDTYHETQVLLVDVFKRMLQKKEIIERTSQSNHFIDIADIIPVDFIGKREPEMELNTAELERRVKVEESIFWLNRLLVMFFSADLPDFLSFYEGFLPLLQAIAAAKSSVPDQIRSPFQQAVDMCTRTLTNQDKSLNYINQFLTILITIYRSLGRGQEATNVAEIGLEMTDLMCDSSDSNKMNNRCKILLHLAQIHQQNSSNPAFNAHEELNLAEHYYLSDRGWEDDTVLCKDLSYANFLCERKRFPEAVAVLEDMRNLGELLWNKYVHVEYSSCAFFGAGVENSVKTDGELFTTVGGVFCNLMVRAYVGVGKKKEGVAACETLMDVDLLDIHESQFGKRPSCKPYLVEDCHRELLSLLNKEDRHQFQNCDFPLSSSIVAKLFYMLGEYEMAAKYFPKNMESLDMLEMKIFCLRLAGNQLVDSNRGNESLTLFQDFLEMLQVKEGFLDKPLHDQWEILQTYSFANQYYLFRSLGKMHAETENIDAAIQCYERCIELDEDFMCGQDIVALLSDLYQIKALTFGLDNGDSWMEYMFNALGVFQMLLQKTAELTAFIELKYASLLTRLDCHEDAFEHFWNVVLGGADDTLSITYGNVEKALLDVYLRREIEARRGEVSMPMIVLTGYEIISTYAKMNEFIQEDLAQDYLSFLEKYVEDSEDSLVRSMAGYAYMIAGNKEKAAEIFVSVLEMNPGHPPVIEALKSCGM